MNQARHPIHLPLEFNGTQVNLFGLPPASSEALGDTRTGSSCNFDRLTLIPHCNGTHTECMGHLTDARLSIARCLIESRFPGQLITIEPELASIASDTSYTAPITDTDRLITRPLLERSIQSSVDTKALVVRTLPNPIGKRSASYGGQHGSTIAPFFTHDALHLIVELGVEHLIVDLPSVDRLNDQGRLGNHRIFWRLPAEGEITPDLKALRQHQRIGCTITELVYIPEEVTDGAYTVEIQIPPFESDAAPSRVFLLS